MNLYEFANFSDNVTFYAADDEIAKCATLLIGNGHCFCNRLNEDGSEGEQLDDTCFMFFDKVPDAVIKKSHQVIDCRPADLGTAMLSFAVCRKSEREIYDEYTSNSTDAEKKAKWDDKHRTSLTDYCGYAWKLGSNLLEKAKGKEMDNAE